jgi:hypothetical protein
MNKRGKKPEPTIGGATPMMMRQMCTEKLKLFKIPVGGKTGTTDSRSQQIHTTLIRQISFYRSVE